MITIPIADIKAKIKEQKGLSDDEINNKIKTKLDQLSGLISEEGAAHIIANELGVNLEIAKPGEKLQIKGVLAGMRNIELDGKVTRKYELREFNTEKRSGKLASFIISDETGFVRVVLWNDQTDQFENFKEGDIVKIEGGYVRDNNGRKEVHLGDNAKLTINPEGVDVKASEAPSNTRKKLSEIKEGDDNIEVLATIVQVFDIRFFEVDGETGRRVIQKEGKYYLGEQEVTNITHAYVMNLILDDGTANIRTVLWRNQIQALLGLSNEEVLKFKEEPAEFENIKNELLGSIVKIIGRVNQNQNFERLEIVANFVYKDVNPEAEIKNLEKEKEQVNKTETTNTNSSQNSSQNTEQTSQTENTSNQTQNSESSNNESKEEIQEPNQQDTDSNVQEQTNKTENTETNSEEEKKSEQTTSDDEVEKTNLGTKETKESEEKKKVENESEVEEFSIDDLEDI